MRFVDIIRPFRQKYQLNAIFTHHINIRQDQRFHVRDGGSLGDNIWARPCLGDNGEQMTIPAAVGSCVRANDKY